VRKRAPRFCGSHTSSSASTHLFDSSGAPRDVDDHTFMNECPEPKHTYSDIRICTVLLHLEPTQDSVDRMRVISAFININVTLAQY